MKSINEILHIQCGLCMREEWHTSCRDLTKTKSDLKKFIVGCEPKTYFIEDYSEGKDPGTIRMEGFNKGIKDYTANIERKFSK